MIDDLGVIPTLKIPLKEILRFLPSVGFLFAQITFMFNVIRIPTKFSKTVKRLSNDERLELFDLLITIWDWWEVQPPDSIVWDLLSLIYGEWMNMESNIWEYNHNWKWWITKDNQKFRNSYWYKKWRLSIISRDYFECTKCKWNSDLQAHHVNDFANHKDQRLDVDNWVTLCKKCHILLHKHR